MLSPISRAILLMAVLIVGCSDKSTTPQDRLKSIKDKLPGTVTNLKEREHYWYTADIELDGKTRTMLFRASVKPSGVVFMENFTELSK